ncbi:DNA-binding protein [Colwellia sp. MT41]|uniref:Heat shock protein HspQ n=1 Tax=Colwellia marinimaniae TaxID=1513592 RepID=A0ABQ0MXK8_9GAMM|nr:MULTISPECIES: heat shock protein HspQ [Colwellia]ALO35257.1 DNA-binding protein [Colwellia sp. MT41]GAW97116.1 DNA-binding protein [Colwellia marinimaniae]
MGKVTNITKVKFSVGDLIQHRLFAYRGVIVDVDVNFQLTDDWYDQVAKSRPPKDKPWYSVLVHGSSHSTYVAEQNLAPDDILTDISHPKLTHYFSTLENGRYIRNKPMN